MSFWDGSFFNYSVPDLNEEPPVEYSYGTIDLNDEPNADVGFDSQASYGFVYDDSKQSNPEEGYEEKSGASNVNWETKESIERFVVQLGLYYEPETVREEFIQGLTQGEEGVMRAWWAQISYTPFTGHRVRASMIRDPLIRYIHRCIVTTISGSGQSQEWVTTTDLFYLHSLIVGMPCNLARCFALYYASFYHRQERGTLWGGAFVTHIACTRCMGDMLDDLPAIEPRKLDRRTVISMKLAADISGLGLRFIGLDGRPFQPAQVIIVQEQQQQDGGPMPEPEPIQEEPVQSPPREEEPPQHPPHVYRVVRLTEPLEALLHQIAGRCDETAQRMARVERRLDRYEDLVQWTVASEHARRDGTQLPPYPEPRVYTDDGSDAGPSGS
ncbi:hypothetical protein R6Q59_018045 [Mikania micrantha]